jgi:nucleoside-diphosphate-sugar epimerase
MATPILVTGAAGRVGAVGRTVTELLLQQGQAVRAMVRTEDERAHANGARAAERAGVRQEECGDLHRVGKSGLSVCGCSYSTDLTIDLGDLLRWREHGKSDIRQGAHGTSGDRPV